ncbi:ABC transporter substrate-binding protein [Paractinoplanes rishiriensis]|uniref:Sugar ABC transporter substrate-binding protein n=1 Tax=Paractinoplanes rishiriensis TaxID=1050105 RepID=A0A919JWA1_9ACTN|nr:ABC transporter substrate-binding protein [Actinoplanes rishiriensis]GIE94444.1 sugar ABC transporter substrate-binding protein [Actinoplanes rishiriensis]
MNNIGRRDALKVAGLAGLAATLPACGRGFGGKSEEGDGKVELNMVWWGAADRATVTQKALDLFQAANPNIRVKTEYQDSTPYKDKLVTRFAAGNPPDLMAMRLDSLVEYSGRGSLLDLTKHADKVDTSALSDGAKALGTVGQSTFGVPAGLNTVGFVINKTLTDQFGVAIPDGDKWSWDDLAAFAKEVTAKSGGKVYGTNFEPYTLANLIVFTRQRGEDLFTADGKLGVTTGTVTAWYEMVNKMRAEKGFPPAGFIDQNRGSSPAQSYLAAKSIASQIIPTNNLLGYNEAAGGNLVLLRMPGEVQGTRRGQSVDCPHLWSIAAQSKHPQEALSLLNFLVNDVEGAKATGTTRGVPASQKVAAAVAPTLAPDDQKATEYLTKLQGEKLPPSYPYPVGGSKLVNILKSISTEVEFKRITPAAAAAQFKTEAEKALTA